MRNNDFKVREDSEDVSEDFDSTNKWHLYQWYANGSPDLNELDANGKTWRPIKIKPPYLDLDSWVPPQVDPVKQVKSLQKKREDLAKEALLECKSRAFLTLVARGMTQEVANEAGTSLILELEKQGLLGAYEVSGGNIKAKVELINSIINNPPEWWDLEMLAIFEETL